MVCGNCISYFFLFFKKYLSLFFFVCLFCFTFTFSASYTSQYFYSANNFGNNICACVLCKRACKLESLSPKNVSFILKFYVEKYIEM